MSIWRKLSLAGCFFREAGLGLAFCKGVHHVAERDVAGGEHDQKVVEDICGL